MKLVATHYLLRRGTFPRSTQWTVILREIRQAIAAIKWPPGSRRFTIHPSLGKKRGQGNGVVPIKKAFVTTLEQRGWRIKDRSNLYQLDAVKTLPNGRCFGAEWETGNISSSHRALNRIFRGYYDQKLLGGALIVPTRDLYPYLTDRIGNLFELEPYFPLWRHLLRWRNGVLAIFAVEHDAISLAVPRIKKGTDGRALV